MSNSAVINSSGRSSAVSAAAVVVGLLTLSNVATVAAPIPMVVIVASMVLAVAGMVALVGLIRNRRWGLWLGAAASLLTAVAAAPGIFAAPLAALRFVAGATVLLGLVGAALLLGPARARADQ